VPFVSAETRSARVAERDGQRGEAVHEEPGGPDQVLGRYRQAQPGEPVEQRAEGDPPLEPGQRGAEAVVHAVPERNVPERRTLEVQAVRLRPPGPVAVRREQPVGAENSVTTCDLQVLMVGARRAGLLAVAGLTCRSVGSAVWWEGAIAAIGQDVLDPVGEPADAIPSIHIART
jgi:hypothetical protein